jgi:SAM-dependent methyltransferase
LFGRDRGPQHFIAKRLLSEYVVVHRPLGSDMPKQKKLSRYFDLDGGKRARRYTAMPYGHYKEEVYPIFGEILDGMGDDIRVLDIGAGPAHLAYEFYKRRPRSNVHFTLMDACQSFLEIAAERLGTMGFKPELHQFDFNDNDWWDGLGKFDAIVSNNAIFNLTPELLPDFYKTLYRLLNDNGIVLNQQSLDFDTKGFKEALSGCPPALSALKLLTAEETQRMERLKAEAASEQATEEKRIAAEAERLATLGYKIEDSGGYLSIHVPASQHIALMNEAGFCADSIWRKMEFVILAGIKGKPFARNLPP